LFTHPVSAQITPDHSLGNESSIVTPNVKVKDAPAELISGGAVRGNNLFHSFAEFNVSEGGRVYFSNPDGIANILTRVTGNNLSEIFGTLGVNGAANLFLLNPNGIVFGENAALDLNGSFLGTTGDRYLFENGFEYSASEKNLPPLLTINLPVGLQFGNKAEPIEVRGIGHSLEFDNFYLPIGGERPTGLEIQAKNTLALVGGEVNLAGGSLTAPEGRIEIGSVAPQENIALIQNDDGFSLGYQDTKSFKNIHLTQAASIDLSGNAGSSLQLQGNNIDLLDGSVIMAHTLGDDNGGDVNITAADTVKVIGAKEQFFPSIILTLVDATGKGGNLRVNADNLLIERGQIASTTRAKGKGGSLNININNLQLQDGGQITSNTHATGDGGGLSITAKNIEVNGVSSVYGRSSLVFSSTSDEGRGGNLTIDTNNLFAKDGGQIVASAFAAGDSGDLSVAAKNIKVLGFSPVDGQSSLLLTSTFGEGKGGNSTIATETLLAKDGGYIGSGTFGVGDNGDLSITAKNIEVIGVSSVNGQSSFLSTSTFREGKGGNLTIATDSLLANDGGYIGSGAFGNGDSGDLSITAKNIEVIGVSSVNGRSSTLSTNSSC
jgi:filamentous hemagglutinin family protein